MNQKMKRNINPEKVLKNLKQMIEKAEEAFAEKGAEALNEEEISDLRERVQAGFNRLREYYSGVGGRVSEYYSDAEDRLRDYYEDVEGRLRTGVETTDETLRTHPYQMATISFGVGVIVGAMLRMNQHR